MNHMEVIRYLPNGDDFSYPQSDPVHLSDENRSDRYEHGRPVHVYVAADGQNEPRYPGVYLHLLVHQRESYWKGSCCGCCGERS